MSRARGPPGAGRAAGTAAGGGRSTNDAAVHAMRRLTARRASCLIHTLYGPPGDSVPGKFRLDSVMAPVLLVLRLRGGREVKGSPEGAVESGISRRKFLRGLGLGGAGGAIATLLPRIPASAATTTTFKHVWRLSHEGE